MVTRDNFWLRIIYIISIIITVAVAFLILGPRPQGFDGSIDVSQLPIIHATFNGITAILLIYGYYLIRQKNQKEHKNIMLTAFGTSSAFLVSYVIYHWFKAGPKQYTGDFSEIYYFILITHIILAVIIIPMALVTLYRGWTDSLKKHRKIAKVTLPVWLYVSITGVLIYWMLY